MKPVHTSWLPLSFHAGKCSASSHQSLCSAAWRTQSRASGILDVQDMLMQSDHGTKNLAKTAQGSNW